MALVMVFMCMGFGFEENGFFENGFWVWRKWVLCSTHGLCMPKTSPNILWISKIWPWRPWSSKLWLELQLNELVEIRRERGELGLGSEGGIIVMKMRKLTQLTHGVRESAWQRYGRPTTSNPKTHHCQSCQSRNPPHRSPTQPRCHADQRDEEDDDCLRGISIGLMRVKRRVKVMK